MKRLVVAATMIAMLAAHASPAVGTQFPDVPDARWYAPAVTWAADNGIMTGYPNGAFGPDDPTRRKQVVSWLWRQAGSPRPSIDNPYPDVPDSAWYADAALWANEAGIVTGLPGGSFGPEQPALRRQVVSWLWRRQWSPPPVSAAPYPDVPATAWYADAAAWATEQGVVTGYPNRTFGPDDRTLRKQVASWLWREAGGESTGRPNVVLVFTDDQTLESLRVMDQTEDLIGDHGTTFTQAVANYPLCCPARATLLTGQYAHNHGVLDNTLPYGGYTKFDPTKALPVWLSDAGYQTAHVGKYLNFYANDEASTVVPPGWDRWFTTTDPYPTPQGYYGYDAVVDGTVVSFGEDDDDYLTDVLADRAVDDTRVMAATGRPFYLHVSTLAPHTGADRGGSARPLVPAPRHDGAMADEIAPASPSIGEEDLSDKPTWVRDYAEERWDLVSPYLQYVYSPYLETLLAVDDLVGDLVDELDRLDELDNTVFVFTSDNGWTFGEHKIAFQKVLPYEEIARVPLLIRGPGFPSGVVRDQPVGHIDIVPTLLEAAGVTPPTPRDGEALQPFAADAGFRADRAVLIADGPLIGLRRHYDAVRTASEWYTEHGPDGADGIEYYDLTDDPFQLVSRHDDPTTLAARNRLNAVLDQLVGCQGLSCRVTDP